MTDKIYESMVEAFRSAGGPCQVFDKNAGYIMIHHNKLCKSNNAEGLEISCDETKDGISLNFRMARGHKLANPIYLCFGMIPEEGKQHITVEGIVEDDASLEFQAYCVFPNAVNVLHSMQGEVRIGNNARFKYNEIHSHGKTGGVRVMPKVKIILGEDSVYTGTFSCIEGRAGTIDLDYEAIVGARSKADIVVQSLCSGDDIVKVRDKLILEGEDSKGLLKSRFVAKDSARIEVISEIIATGAGSRGHVDCIETLLDSSQGKATPIVDVRHKDARVTHEAAIGSVSKKQLEVLMSKGLDEEQAIDILAKGLLR
jgi:hypothetical protein